MHTRRKNTKGCTGIVFLAGAVVLVGAALIGDGIPAIVAVGLSLPAVVAGVYLLVAGGPFGRGRQTRRTIRVLDRMTGRQFEAWVAATLRAGGFSVRDMPHAGDSGVDVLCAPPGYKGLIAIQAKRYKGKVGNDAVQQVIAGGQYYDCRLAVVVTQSRFTTAAKRQAQRADPPVLLIDRRSIHNLADLLVAAASRVS